MITDSLHKIPLLVICGPTGSGKSAMALELAQQIPLEIVCADSRQIYRMMDIGTAKASPAEQTQVLHHMIDLIDPDQEFSVAAYVDLARPLIEQIYQRGKLPCIVGGTGLYIKALLGGLAQLPSADPLLRQRLHQREQEQGKGTLHRELQHLDPQSAAVIHPHNLIRTVRALEVCLLSGRQFSAINADHNFVEEDYRVAMLAPDYPRQILYQRIDERTREMLEAGLVDEVKILVERYGCDVKALQTLGYREVLQFLGGGCNAEQLGAEIQLRTRQYAKKQLTWFRKDPDIFWVDSTDRSDRVMKYIENTLII
ncbi:MAG TPA: tRNA (adenosine(37)-N6)-dimethylallyltransferase MiaA [Pelovirga sp.]|nr:tRNA (adenosine(37)-N6)-dimethylallyltransferase MiaA [Pelovirga sp.]